MTGIEGMVVYAGGFGAGVAGGAILSEIQYEVERVWIARNLKDSNDYMHAYVWSMMAEVFSGVSAVALFVAAAAEQNAEVAGFAVGFLADKLRWRDASRQLLPGK